MRLDFAYCIPRELSKFTSGGVVQRHTWHLLDYSLDNNLVVYKIYGSVSIWLIHIKLVAYRSKLRNAY